MWCFFFQAEDGIRDLVRSRGLGDVYKRQDRHAAAAVPRADHPAVHAVPTVGPHRHVCPSPVGLSLIHI